MRNQTKSVCAVLLLHILAIKDATFEVVPLTFPALTVLESCDTYGDLLCELDSEELNKLGKVGNDDPKAAEAVVGATASEAKAEEEGIDEVSGVFCP